MKHTIAYYRIAMMIAHGAFNACRINEKRLLIAADECNGEIFPMQMRF